ncbi:MAG: hypothetical protein WD066_01995 [Planctomycetaceae bacterium]
MKILLLLKSLFGSLVFAAGQLFAWLNRREERKERDEVVDRISEVQSAAAKPTPENADALNRWLARGRSGRLRDRRGMRD